MEDYIIIALLAVLFGLGFIPVFYFSRFVNRIRKPIIDKSKKAPLRKDLKNGGEDDPVREFERTGDVFLERK